MPLETNTAEGGADGVAATPGNTGGVSGAPFGRVVLGTSGTVTFDDAWSSHGTLSYEVLPTGAGGSACYVGADTAGVAQIALRTYVRFDTMPSGATQFLRLVLTEAGASTVGNLFVGADGSWGLQNQAAATVYSAAPGSVTTGVTYRVEYFWVVGAGTGQARGAVYLGDSYAAVADSGLLTGQSNGAGNVGAWRVGKTSNTGTWSMHLDDVAWSEAAAGLIGAPVENWRRSPAPHPGYGGPRARRWRPPLRVFETTATEVLLTAGLAEETDSSAPLAAVKATAVGLPTQGDTSAPLSLAKTVTLGLPTETDSGQTVTGVKAHNVGLPLETDSGQTAARAKAITLGLPAEVDTAVPLTTGNTVNLGLPVETGIVLTLGTAKITAFGQATETDAGLTPDRAKTFTAGQGQEADGGLPLTADSAITFTFGMAAEVDAAAALAPQAGGVVVRPSTGTVIRPGVGVVVRPAAGVAARPATGTVVRPATGVVIRP